MLAIGLVAWIALAGQGAAQPEPDFTPLYPPVADLSLQTGDRMLLGSFVPAAWDVRDLIDSGISLFGSETDELASPESGETPFSLPVLVAQRKAIEDLGAIWTVTVHTTFPTPFPEGGARATLLPSGKTVPAWSVWEPERVRRSANSLGAVNRALPRLKLVSLGIYGEYGDAGFFTGLSASDTRQRALWSAKLQSEPPEAGFWAGDLKAQESWAKRLRQQYGSTAAAWTAWGMTPPTLEALPIPITPEFPYSARLEFMAWYREAIPALAQTLVGISREIFPDASILVPVGPPNDSPYLGLDVFRLAQSVQGSALALKVTNVGFYDFPANWAISLAKIRGAARAANIPIWTEAPNPGTSLDFSERIFSALSLGSQAHVDWPEILRTRTSLLDSLRDDMVVAEPVCDVAVLHPTSAASLRPNEPVPGILYRSLVDLRDYLDFDVLEESAVRGGALKNYRVAILFEGTVWDAETLNVLKSWVAAGGVIAAYDFGKTGDHQGATAVHQELFGFASQLAPAKFTETWIGELPENYEVRLGGDQDADFLLGRWGASTKAGRVCSTGSVLRLPVSPQSAYTISLRFSPTKLASKTLEVSLANRKVASISMEGGLSEFQIFVPATETAQGSVRIGLAGMVEQDAVVLQSVVATKEGADAEASPLDGYFDAPVSVEEVAAWTQPFGKGLVTYMPAKRDSWKAFQSVVRHLVYRLSRIAPGRADARNLDDKRDGVFVTDLGSRVAAFNSLPAATEKSIGSSKVTLPPGGVAVLGPKPPPDRIIQPESQPGSLATLSLPGASPTAGPNAVHVPEGKTWTATVTGLEAARVRLFARALRDGKPYLARFRVGEVEVAPTSFGSGSSDVYLVGEFEPIDGELRIEVSGADEFDLDALIITANRKVIGYRLRGAATGPNLPRG